MHCIIKLLSLLFFLLSVNSGFSQNNTKKIYIDSLPTITNIFPVKKNISKGTQTTNLHALKEYKLEQKTSYTPQKKRNYRKEKQTIIRFDPQKKICLNDTFSYPEKKILPAVSWNSIADFSYKDNSLIDINHIEINQGLPSNYIRHVSTDKHGFLWIATSAEGLLRFDGKNAQIFNQESGFPANRIYSLTADSKGRIWAGTSNNGVICIEDNHFYTFGKENGLVGSEIFSISEDKNNNIWVTTFGNGAYKLAFDDDENLTSIENFNTKTGLSSNSLTNIEHGKQGKIYFSTYGGGITVFDGEKFNYLLPESGLTAKNIWRVYEDSDAHLWITTRDKGLVYFDNQDFYYLNTANILLSDFSKEIYEISPGQFYLPTYGGGLTFLQFDKQNKTVKYKHITTEHGLSDNRLHFVTPQKNGKLWIGSEGGLNQYDPNSFISFNEKTGLLSKHVRKILQDSNDFLWFVTVDGLSKFDGNHFMNFTKKQGLISNNTREIIQINQNQLCLGTTHGLSLLTINDKSEIIQSQNFFQKNGLPSDHIWALEKDSAGNIWAGTRETGVFYMKKTNNRYIAYTLGKSNGLSNNMIWDIFIDNSQNIWVATESGLDKIEQTAEDKLILTNYSQQQGFFVTSPAFVFQDNNNRIWVGGLGGLSLFFPKGLKNDSSILFQNFTKKEGLSHNQIQYLTQDASGIYWVGTEAGIDRMEVVYENDNQKAKIKVHQFSNKDGLKSHDAMSRAVLYDNQNRIWFGMGNDLSMLNLNNYQYETSAPKVYISKLEINNKNIDFQEIKRNNDSIQFKETNGFLNIPIGLKLKYNQNNLAFQFSAIEWNNSDKLDVWFKLSNVDEKWQSAGQKRKVFYPKLFPGHYVLQYKVVSDFGNQSNVKTYSFSVLPPWWKTIWAYFLYFVLFFGVVYVVIALNLRRLKQQKAILEIMVSERTKEIAAQKIEIEQQAKELQVSNERLLELDKFKQSMTQMLVHDLKAPLNTVIHSDNLKKIRHTGKQMLNLVWNILDVQKYETSKMQLNIEQTNLNNIISQTIEEVEFLASQKNIQIKSFFTEIYTVVGDAEILKRVFVNFFTNAIKYSTKNSVVEISKHIQNKQITISVKDYGIGIRKEHIPKIFESYSKLAHSDTDLLISTGLGLTFCKKAVEAHGSKIHVESAQNEGAVFSFSLDLVEQKTLKSIVAVDKKETSFVSEDIEYLIPFVQQLKNKHAYELSDVFKIVSQIDKHKSETITTWAEKLEESVINSNSKQFLSLLQEIEKKE